MIIKLFLLQNIKVYEETEELVSIIKQAAKERLQLEQQVTRTKVRFLLFFVGVATSVKLMCRK